jgi:hypothetical protein
MGGLDPPIQLFQRMRTDGRVKPAMERNTKREPVILTLQQAQGEDSTPSFAALDFGS